MGKNKYIETPESLFDLFKQYVHHEAENPMYKIEYVGKDGERVNTPLQVPITFEGFECYLADKKIINDLGDYSCNKDGRYSDYATIITRIQKNCFVQNYKGASVGLFNANLIAKKLGLIAKSEQTNIEKPIFNGLDINVKNEESE
jgi:hypothetical protein